jgi:NTE family protein
MSSELRQIEASRSDPRDPESLVRMVPLFADLEAALLDEIVARIQWFSLPGGIALFEAGDVPDALYFVASGSLGAYTVTPSGHRRSLGRISSGETVGEMALISGKARNATVIALRDTQLGRLSREDFEHLMLSHPRGLLHLTQLMVQRLESSQQHTRGTRAIPRTIAVVPQSLVDGAMKFATQLVSELQRLGRTELVWNRRGADHTSDWFHAVERENDFVVYVCDVEPNKWSKLCLRQADAVLLLARADGSPSDWRALGVDSDRAMIAQRMEMVLVHQSEVSRGAASRWLNIRPSLSHHHVRGARDVARLARYISGNALGLVLSGGGARGFAHLGVLKAIREANIPVDAIGGTSIGAVIAAGFASEWDHDELVARVRRSFVDTNPVNDYTIPLVALASGRKVSGLLRREFQEAAIEDLPLPYFCVSTNLSSGQIAVHRRGELWRWLRASVAIPGVLPPVVHNGELFADGATINNLPVDVMRDAGVGKIIGVDVGADRVFTTDSVDSDAPPFWRILQWFSGRKQRINILQILWRAGMVNSAANTAARRELSDLLLQPPLEQIDMLDWRAFDRAIDAGYRYAAERLHVVEQWQRVAERDQRARARM